MLDLKLDHLLHMTDRVGLLQHAKYAEPNPDFGYCTDDNARALLLITQALGRAPAERRLERLFGLYFRFVQAAFDQDACSFRNLLGYDSKWVPEPHAGDAGGRALWALGSIVGADANGPQRTAARVMVERALPMAEAMTFLRPMACAILGLCAYLQREQSQPVRRVLELLASRLAQRFDDEQQPDWPWPEALIAYENARIPQALLAAGRTLQDSSLVELGLRSLRWLTDLQTDNGLFSPVGNHGWYPRGGVCARFEQQPIEADTTIAACAEAFRADGDARWLDKAQAAFDWFEGKNAIGQPVCVPETGGCRDGLSATQVNQNQGAESTLAWLTSQLNMQALVAAAGERPQAVTVGR